MRKCPTSVIPSEARDLVFSATYEEEIPRLHLGMTVATQSPRVDGGVFKRGMPIVMGLEIFNTETGPHVTNTLAVTHDDAATGYACGFNSNGDITIDLIATGKPGTHLINLYPAIYKGKDRVPWNYQTPFLTYAQEFPARFAGYRLSAYRLAIEVSP
jgi:hypothetical protein